MTQISMSQGNSTPTTALLWLLLLCFMTLSGCTSPNSFRSIMQSSGEMPELDRSDSLTGPDTDNNGIRDDIDRYLLTVEASEAEMLALIQVARALQAVQASDLSSDKKLRELSDGIVKASSCVIDTYESVVDGHRENRKLEGYTANTQNRTRHYIKYNQLRNGSIIKAPRIVCDGVAQ